MTNEQFNKLVDDRIDLIKKTLFAKGKGYSFNGDRLHNFKLAANMQRTTVPKAAYGIAAKHFVSIIDLVNGDLPATDSNLDEKITDAIAYLLLIEAALTECQEVGIGTSMGIGGGN